MTTEHTTTTTEEAAPETTKEATGLACVFEAGYGTGGSNEAAGYAATPEQCATAVQTQYPEANGAVYAASGGQCFAKIGMTAINAAYSSYQSCKFEGCCFAIVFSAFSLVGL